MSKRLRVLVTNVYSFKNKGDAAIVISLIREMRRVFPDSELMIQTADYKHDAGKYGEPVTNSLLWTLLSSVRDESAFKRVWTLTGLLTLSIYLCSYKLVHWGPRFLLTKELREFVDMNRLCDLAVGCGGGYLRTANERPRDTLLLFVTCLNFLAAYYTGKPVYLYSQSVGPVYGKLQRRILRFALNRVQVVEAREEISYQFLKDLGLKCEIVRTADAALLLGGAGIFPDKYVSLQPGRLYVGITVRKWFNNDTDLEAYIESIATTVDYLIEHHNAEVFYAPQVIAEDFGDDDRIIARRVWDEVRNQELFHVVEADLHPFEIIGLCGAMDVFMGTRMHSNIFALISHVPVVAIEYEHKTRGIMLGLGLGELTIDINDVTAEKLEHTLNMVIPKRKQYVQRIKTNLPKQIAEGRRAADIIEKMYVNAAAA